MDKQIRILIAAAALALAPAALAQRWEIGGGAGGSFYPSNTVTSGSASATIDPATAIAGGVWLSNSINSHLGGEIRLDYTRGDLDLTSGGTTASFLAEAYTMHYEFQWHLTNTEARVRPFVAVGGGVKYYRGIGSQVEFQPLSQFALLSQTTDLKPVASAGGGIKFRVTGHLGFRVEVHDYFTPFPTNVIVPNVGSKISGWMQQIVPMAGISYVF